MTIEQQIEELRAELSACDDEAERDHLSCNRTLALDLNPTKHQPCPEYRQTKLTILI
jgi:hypothetical protein